MLKPKITPAATMPVTLAEAKEQSVVDFGDDDAKFERLVRAAVSYLEGWEGILGRAISEQSVTQQLSGFGCMRLQYGPATALTSVTYFDSDNAQQTLTGGTLLEDESGSYVYHPDTLPATYARPDAVTVAYTAGGTNLPEGYKLAILQLVALWYEFPEGVATERGAATAVPFAAKDLIAPLRKVGL